MLLSLTQFLTIIIESAKLTYFTRLWSLQSRNNFKNEKQYCNHNHLHLNRPKFEGKTSFKKHNNIVL